MSAQHIAVWKQAADMFDRSYAAIGDQGQNDSPCEGWSVDDVVAHCNGTQAGFLGATVGVEIDPSADWPTIRAALEPALLAEGALEGMTEGGPMGPMPKTVILGIGASDLLLHAWDIARAVGADETMPVEAAQATLAGLQRFPEEMMRSEGMFGAALDAADDADVQAQVLAFAGRQA